MNKRKNITTDKITTDKIRGQDIHEGGYKPRGSQISPRQKPPKKGEGEKEKRK